VVPDFHNIEVGASMNKVLRNSRAYVLFVVPALTRMKFLFFSKMVYGILLLAILIPPASLLIPLYIMVRQLGFYNTHLALILPYSAFGIPLTVFVIAAFLKSIPL
jgi:raffinose/stachyose/melibiose transport system permease protein